MVQKIPGFVNTSDKIIPAGSWCCKINTGGGSRFCHAYLRTNWFFAQAGCHAEIIAGGFGSNGGLIPCPQNETCCSAVGCIER